MRSLFLLALLASFAAALVLPPAAGARSVWADTADSGLIQLEILRPALEGLDDLTLTSNVYYLSGRRPIGDGMSLAFQVPYLRWAEDGRTESESALGNVYVGIESSGLSSDSLFDAGVRLSTTPEDDNAIYLGIYSDFIDGLEAWVPDVTSVIVGSTYTSVSPDGVAFRLRVAPVIWFNAEDRYDDDTELWVLYGAQLAYESRSSAVGGGVSGRLLLSEDDLDFGERSLHQAGLFVNLRLGRWRPGVQVRVPLDDELDDMVNPTFSLSVGVATD